MISVTVIVGNTAMLKLVEKRQFPQYSTGETGAHAKLKYLEQKQKPVALHIKFIFRQTRLY